MHMTCSNLLRRLLRNASGVAMTEFALGAPFLLMAGLWGTETANYALVNMKISQLAIHVADNAARVGDTSTLQNRRVYESDINDVLLGANIQGGPSIDLFEHGRVIISSVEIWDQSVHASSPGAPHAPGVQFIHWQRCLGAKHAGSNFGNQNQALPDGIGPEDAEVTASAESPVIFVELNYEYQPLISSRFISNPDIRAIASFIVRDSRDKTGLLQRNVTDPDTVASCTVYSNAEALMS
jgi:hypothetical protein